MKTTNKNRLNEKIERFEERFKKFFDKKNVLDSQFLSLTKDTYNSLYINNYLKVIKKGIEYFVNNAKPEVIEKILDQLIEEISNPYEKLSISAIMGFNGFVKLFSDSKSLHPQQLISILADKKIDFFNKFFNKSEENFESLIIKLYTTIPNNKTVLPTTINTQFIKNFILSNQYSNKSKYNLEKLFNLLNMKNENQKIIGNLIYFAFQDENIDGFKEILSLEKDDFESLMQNIYKVNFDNLTKHYKYLSKINNKEKTDIDSLPKYITETHDLKKLLNHKYGSIEASKFIKKFTAFKINGGFAEDIYGMLRQETSSLLKIMHMKYSIYFRKQAKLIADDLNMNHSDIPFINISENILNIYEHKRLLNKLNGLIKLVDNNKLLHKFYYFPGEGHAHMIYIKIDKTKTKAEINVEIIDPNKTIIYKAELQEVIDKTHDKYKKDETYKVEAKMVAAGKENIDGICTPNILFEMENRIESIIKNSKLNKLSKGKLYNAIKSDINLEEIYQETLDDIAREKLNSAIYVLNKYFKNSDKTLIKQAILDYKSHFNGTKYQKICAKYLGIQDYEINQPIYDAINDIKNIEEQINDLYEDIYIL